MWSIIPVFVLLVLAASGVLVERTQGSTSYTGPNLIRLSWHSSIVLDTNLYIDGGEINFFRNGILNGVTPKVNDTLSIDLTRPFTNNNSAVLNRFPKPRGAPTLNSNALWASAENDAFYNFGGIPSFTAYIANTLNNIWKYTPSSEGGAYAAVPTSSSSSNPSLLGIRTASALSACGNGIAYILGGYNSVNATYPPVTPIPGLLVYNTTDNTWRNESALGYSAFGTALNGRMHFISSYGSSGLLVALGGEMTGPGPWHELGENLVSFANISFYDPADRTWYWQTAAGATGPDDIPTSAVMFCSAVATAAESETIEIFVYGGHNDRFTLESPEPWPTDSDKASQEIFNTVYVLSIPGFVWFKVNDTSAQPRTGHTCERIGNRHMISIGGLNPTLDWQSAVNQSDPWNQTLGIFDMVNLNWTGTFDPNASTYVPPQVVRDWYAKPTSNGSIDWSSQALKSILLAGPSASATPSNTTSSSPSPIPSSSTSSSKATLAGAVVGSTVGLAILANAAYFVLRYRQPSLLLGLGKAPEQLRTTAEGMPAELDGKEKVVPAELSGKSKRILRSELGNKTSPAELDAREKPQELDSKDLAL